MRRCRSAVDATLVRGSLDPGRFLYVREAAPSANQCIFVAIKALPRAHRRNWHMLVNRILLPFHANSAAGSEHVVSAAFGLARRFGAEVEGLYPQAALTTALPYATESTPPAMLQVLMDRARATYASLAA